MKKYRIVHAFPYGFMIEQRVCLFFWKSPVVFWSTRIKKPWIYDTIDEAREDIEKLKKVRKVVE